MGDSRSRTCCACDRGWSRRQQELLPLSCSHRHVLPAGSGMLPTHLACPSSRVRPQRAHHIRVLGPQALPSEAAGCGDQAAQAVGVASLALQGKGRVGSGSSGWVRLGRVTSPEGIAAALRHQHCSECCCSTLMQVWETHKLWNLHSMPNRKKCNSIGAAEGGGCAAYTPAAPGAHLAGL